MRVMLIKLSAGEHIFGICMHHIISDGWSLGILAHEISKAYEAYSSGEEPDFEALSIQYADYAVWQRQVFSEAQLEQELASWAEHLSGYQDLDLPTDYARPKEVSGEGGGVNFHLGSAEVGALRQFCQDKQVTFFTVFVTSVYVLLCCYSRQEDICIGMPVANRDKHEIEDLIGFFVNT